MRACRRVCSSSAPQPPAPADLADLCRGRLAAYKVPARWLFTDIFPLTTTGKIRRDLLSAQAAASATGTSP